MTVETPPEHTLREAGVNTMYKKRVWSLRSTSSIYTSETVAATLATVHPGTLWLTKPTTRNVRIPMGHVQVLRQSLLEFHLPYEVIPG